MPLIDPGLWCDIRPGKFRGRAALFLDRDGVVVVDTNYLGRVEDLQMIAGAVDAIARCNSLGVPVFLVTNQSGIGRGYYDWQGFAAVQEAISAELAAGGAQLDAVLACAYHGEGREPFRVDNHPWRKPNPGMLVAAAQGQGIDLSRSWMIGDQIHDLKAGQAAGLAGATLLAPELAGEDPVSALGTATFSAEIASDLAAAVTKLLDRDQFGMKR